MDIFNPTLCLAKELKSSWCQNMVTELDQSKVPIEVVEGVPRLKMVHDESSPHSWFAAALPTQSSWEPCDISEFNFLSFTAYMEEGSGGVGLRTLLETNRRIFFCRILLKNSTMNPL